MKALFFATILCIICVGVSQCGPTVPPVSYGEIRYVYYSYSDMYARQNGSIIELGHMALYTDMTNHKLYLNSSAQDIIAPRADSVLNTSLLYQNSAPTYEVSNHQCYVSGNAYGDFYWWIQYAQFTRNVSCPMYNTTSMCSLYTYSYESTNYTVILTSNNFIQQINVTDYFIDRDIAYEMGYFSMDFHLFEPFITGYPFVPMSICQSDQSNTYFCPAAPKITETIYYLHNYDDTKVSPNVGDLIGYTAYLCWKSSLGDDKVLTQAVVDMNPTWGQYAVCYSYDNCVGGNSKSVGRECPYGFEYFQGQCANLTSYGQWFSITNKARCPLLSPIGTNGCAWRFKYIVKSISFKCLINQGFFDACYSDGHIPFNNAASIVNRAFQNCPAVSQTEVSDERILDNFSRPQSSSHLDASTYPVRLLKRIQNNMIGSEW